MSDYLRYKEFYDRNAIKWAKNNPEKRKEILKRYNASHRQYKKEWYQKKRYGHVIPMDECVRCGSEDKLLVHHADGNNGKMGKTLNNNRDNLIVLCRVCHPKVHHRGIIREVLTI
jgi:5-methylcytosine-specific restriction endonuclease McrA